MRPVPVYDVPAHACRCCPKNRLELPLGVDVEIVNTLSALHHCFDDLTVDGAVVGIDVEWRPGSNIPALMQLATESRILLLDLVALRHNDEVPILLKKFLTERDVVKLGWHFETDLRVLSAWMPCLNTIESFVEVSNLMKDFRFAQSTSLAVAVKNSLNANLCKAEQCSDWEARPLSKRQVNYAALDAYVLILLINASRCTVPQPTTFEVSSVSSRCRAKQKSCSSSAQYRLSCRSAEKLASRSEQTVSRSLAKREAFIARFCVRSEVYSNCRIYSASGLLVAHCDKSKALWYVEKGLAVPVSSDDDIYSVCLHFRPEERNGDGGFEALASVIPRKNRCVVCGTDSDLSRYHLIPKAYQKYFAVELKAHRSHDIVLLCVDCHEISNRAVMHLKRCIARELCAPLQGEGLYEPSQEERSVVKAATALLRDDGKIPADRIALLRSTVYDWWIQRREKTADADPFSTDGLRYIARLGGNIPKHGGWQALGVQSEHYRSHGHIVVDKLMSTADGEDSLHNFIVRWRKYFLHTMAPKYMPDDWRLDYRIPSRLVKSRGDGRNDLEPSLPVSRQELYA